MKPELHEQRRLEVLREYRILGTPSEETFDRITRLAARIFEVPVSLVTLIDEERHWSKSCFGVEEMEMDRTVSFCAHTIETDEVLVVPDATRDPRFADNPMVTVEAGIRFYAGAPLRTPDGFRIGSLCLVDTRPRELDAAGRDTLRELAGVVMQDLQLRLDALERSRSEQALRRSEQRYRTLFENNPAMVLKVNTGGTILAINRFGARQLGYMVEELIGLSVLDLIHPDDRAAGAAIIARTLQEPDTVQRGELRKLRKHGDVMWAQQTLRAVQTGEGEPAALMVCEDVTERKRVEERLRLLESVTVHANDVILITEAQPIDPPGPRILYVNDAFTKLTGYASDEAVGRSPRMLQGPKTDRRELNRIRVALSRWEPVVAELVNYRKDGSEFWTELSIAPVADPTGTFTHWIGIQREVTERKQFEQALRETTEEAERAKSEFLSRMSHELRTPMNSILGFAQLLDLSPLDEADRESVDQILRGGRHLLDLINEVLDLSRIEAGRLALSPEPVNVAELLAEVADALRPLLAERSIELRGSRPPADPLSCDRVVQTDRQRLKQVLINLLSNAIKYNRVGGLVEVSCEERPGARLRIRVRDTGIGIAPAQQAQLFNAFDRLGAESGGAEGTGLGLALSKRLIEAMDGQIGVESEIGRGSTFWVELPHAPGEPGVMPEHAVDTGAATRWTVLQIDDNPSSRRLVSRVLARRPGVRLITAADGRDGIRLAAERQPALILMDLHLPDVVGDDLLRALRTDPATRDIPIVVLSADATSGHADRLRIAGATDYLTKPLDVNRFLQTIDRLLPLMSKS